MAKRKTIKLPRLMWQRSPVTKAVENKKAKDSKNFCRGKKSNNDEK